MSNEIALATFKGLSTLLRPRYTRGLLLEDDDLTAAVEYTRNSTRLLFKSLFGCGVICGLGVAAEVKCHGQQLHVKVKKGVALDCLGNPIEVPGEHTLVVEAGCDEELPEAVWVSVCYLEKNCRPKDVSCAPDEDAQVVQTRSHDGFEIKLHASQPACACSCAPKQSANGSGSKTSSKCCSDSTAAAQSVNDVPPHDPCACYDAHDAGICGCDCDCSCVVICKIDVTRLGTTTEPSPYDLSVRRFIRPVLLGRTQCQSPQTQSPPDQGGELRAVVLATRPEGESNVEIKAETLNNAEVKVEAKLAEPKPAGKPKASPKA